MSKEVRLIDANVLIEALRTEEKECEEVMTSPSFWSVFKIINEQPTAYDVEKVVDRIKELGTQEDGFPQVIGKETAINVIRNGGKE